MNMNALSSEEFYAKNYDYYENAKSEKTLYMEAVNSFVADNFECGPILDVGCGDGLRALSIFGKRQSDIVGMDSCAEMLEKARRNGISNVLNENIASPSGGMMNQFQERFGTILCLWNVLGHIIRLEERERAIGNMFKLLTTGGMLFVDVNNRLNIGQYGILRSLRNGLAGIFQKETGIFILPINNSITRVYLSTKGEFVNLLEKNGFHVEQLVYVNYRNGKIEKSAFSGQLLATCRKKL